MARTRNITKPDSNARNAEFLGWAATLVDMNKGKKKMKMHDALEVIKAAQQLILEDVKAGNYRFTRFLFIPANDYLRKLKKRAVPQISTKRTMMFISKKKDHGS